MPSSSSVAPNLLLLLLATCFLPLLLGVARACETDLDCYQSPCVNQTCQCGRNPYYLPQEDDCSSGLPAIKRHGLEGLWYVYLVFICVTSGTGCLFMLGFFVRYLVQKGIPPRNVTTFSLASLALAFFLRFFYFSVDPHGLYLILPPVLGRFIFGVFYSVYFSAFTLLMLVWVSLCAKKIDHGGGMLRHIKIPFIVANVILYGFELLMIIWQAINVELNWLLITVYSIYLAIIIIVTSTTHIVFGKKFLKVLGNEGVFRSERKKALTKKITLMSIGVSSLLVCAVLFQFLWLALGFIGKKSTMQMILEEFVLRIIEFAVCFLTLYVLVMRTTTTSRSETSQSRSAKPKSGMGSKLSLNQSGAGDSKADTNLDADVILQTFSEDQAKGVDA